jgi:hypothetical protein
MTRQRTAAAIRKNKSKGKSQKANRKNEKTKKEYLGSLGRLPGLCHLRFAICLLTCSSLLLAASYRSTFRAGAGALAASGNYRESPIIPVFLPAIRQGLGVAVG